MTIPALGTAVRVTVAEAVVSGEAHRSGVSEPAQSICVQQTGGTVLGSRIMEQKTAADMKPNTFS